MSLRAKLMSLLLSIPCAFALAAGTPGEARADECESFTGTWQVEFEVDAKACGEKKISKDTVPLKFTQTGCDVTVDLGSGAKLTGTAKGGTVTLKGSYEKDGTVDKAMTITVSGAAFSGSGEWTYSTPKKDFTCQGTDKVTGAKAG